MPGAPNKPPTSDAPASPAPAETPEQHALRRLAPSRIALRLPIWKGAPSPELLQPFLEAEAHFTAGDVSGADGFLDRLAIRFAEPRWPSLPEPFRALRVPVPRPQPPSWDPDFALAPADKEIRRLQRYAETQLALLRGALEVERAHGTSLEDLAPLLTEAEGALAAGDLAGRFWEPVDRAWRSLRERVPLPQAPAARSAAPAPAVGEDAGA
jgi:hypothetical protein